MERDLIKVSQRLGGGVVADNHHDVASQIAGFLPVQQIGQTVIIGGNEDGDLGAVVGQRQVVVDLKTLGQRFEVVLEIGDGNIKAVQIPFQPGEKQVAAAVEVIVAVQDTAVVADPELRDFRHHAFASVRHRST